MEFSSPRAVLPNSCAHLTVWRAHRLQGQTAMYWFCAAVVGSLSIGVVIEVRSVQPIEPSMP